VVMLNTQQLSGRPWAVSSVLATHVMGVLEREGFAALRNLAGVRAHAATANVRSQPVRGGSVAVIPVMGLLTHRGAVIDCAETQSTAELAALVTEAAFRSEVKAIVLEIDSPGGEVLGGTEAAAAIRDARATKPVVAHVNGEAGSLAYWLAAQADEVIVTPSGAVGSIGVYGVHEDLSIETSARGRKVTYVFAGKYKVERNPHAPLEGAARQYMQSEVDRYYDMFVRDVARGRRVSVDAVRSGFGEGRMLGAKAAVDAGMADAVGTFDQAMRRAAALATHGRTSALAATAATQMNRFRRDRGEPPYSA
jgi:signal peptide peptidase SppA